MKRFFICAVAFMAVIGGSIISWANSDLFPVDHDLYPYYPSLINWEKSKAEFTPPEVCGECHQQQYREWTGSMHALAFRDPLYQGELNKAVREAGREIARQCEGCHSPVGMVTGEITKPGLEGLSSIAMHGVSCDVCHSVSGITHWQTPSHEPENGSFILSPGRDEGEQAVLVKRGPFPPSEDCGGDFHECEESPLHPRAELCASCHQIYHYKKHFPLESTYLEWKHGPYAQNGIVCQDCHMVDIKTFKRSADTMRKPERNEYHHYFNGANYLLYQLAAGAAQKAGDEELALNLKEKYDMAVERLKAAADLQITPIYRDRRLAEIKIRVKNIRAGHNLPTSLTNMRQMWLEVKAIDERGRTFMTSGAPNSKDNLPQNTRIFNSDGMNDDFHFSIDAWKVTSFSRHDTIPPKGYRDVYYGLTAPPGSARVTVEARLRYRQADQGVAESLLSAVPMDIDLEGEYGLTGLPTLPIVDMVDKSLNIPSFIR